MPEILPALDKRKAAVLRAIVREYVRTGQPVGSKVIAERHRLKVSTATIRNDMGVLEELGYIHQPFTSAGRIPTDAGYRWFVDHWPGDWPGLPPSEQRQIDGKLNADFRDLEETLDITSHVLSEVTDSTAVVAAPPVTKHRLRRLELLKRADGRTTLLLIADTGVVEQGVVDLGDLQDEAVETLARKLSGNLEGVAFEDLSERIASGTEEPKSRARKSAPPAGPAVPAVEPNVRAVEPTDAVAKEIRRIVSAGSAQRIFRGGTANILSPGKFGDLETAQNVVGALEQPPMLSSLLQAAGASNSVLIFIGQEVPVEKMQACAVIFAPYEMGPDRHGAVGVIGPTRMDYPHTISAVEAVARSLNRLLDSSEE